MSIQQHAEQQGDTHGIHSNHESGIFEGFYAFGPFTEIDSPLGDTLRRRQQRHMRTFGKQPTTVMNTLKKTGSQVLVANLLPYAVVRPSIPMQSYSIRHRQPPKYHQRPDGTGDDPVVEVDVQPKASG